MADALTQERWTRIKEVFSNALERSLDERQDYLATACQDDLAMRAEVDRLLMHHDDASTFLERTPSAFVRVATSAHSKPIIFKTDDVVNDRFRILRFIGAGGMGEVYEAADKGLGGVHVALKTIRLGSGLDKELEKQFRAEVEIARRITHPNVCRIYDLFETRVKDDAGEKKSVLFLTMELLRGEGLSERLAWGGALSTAELFPLFLDIAGGLEAAHEQGIIHRDLKTSNVMIVSGRDGTEKAILTDFGLACDERRFEAGENEPQLAGTPAYMAPEQLANGNVGFSTDVYSLGVLLFEAVTGKLPFEESSTLSTALKRSSGPPASPRTYRPDLDLRWEAAILKCLAHDPLKRFQTVGELREALQPVDHVRIYTRRAAIAAATVGVGAVSFSIWRGLQPAAIPSLGVLPFENQSGDKEFQYFGEGLAGDLVPMLTRFRGLRVVAPGKSQLKGLTGLKQIGKALHVSTMLTGTVRKEDSHVSVEAQLTNLDDGMPLWSGTYREDMRTLARIRLNLSMEIAGALQPRLSKAEITEVSGPQANNAEAYNLYLLGKHYASYRSDDGLTRSIELLKQSVENDPNFAPAYAALSDVYSIRAGQAGCPPLEYITKAEESAKQSLRLDAKSGEAHTALGFAYGRRWKWEDSAREFRNAISLNPEVWLAHYRYAGLNSVLGNAQVALDEVLIALNQDPLSPLVNAGYGAFLYRARRYDDAVTQLQKTLKSFPDSATAMSDLGLVFDSIGRYDDATAMHRKALETGPGYYFRFVGRLGHALGRAGHLAEAEKIAGELQSTLGIKHYSPMVISNVYLGLARFERAFYWYDMAIQQRDPFMEVLKVDPMNDPLRDDSRFTRLLSQMGLS